MNYYRIRLGMSNAYLIRAADGYVLVDAGGPRKEREILWSLGIMGIAPEDIKLIVVTHAHLDHVGGLKGMQAVSRAPVAVHRSEADVLRSGRAVDPTGATLLGKFGALLLNTFMKKSFPPVYPDILLLDELQLDEYGAAGRVIPVGGHTAGSLAVILESGEVFVGDLASKLLPVDGGPVFPPFAEDVDTLLDSWKRLLDEGATVICPGHGRPFSADLLRRSYRRRRPD